MALTAVAPQLANGLHDLKHAFDVPFRQHTPCGVHRELAAKLDALEQKTERLSLQHETFAGNTRAQLKQVFEALRQLMAPPAQTDKRPIGFVTPQEKKGGR